MIRCLQELEVIVDSIILDGNKAVINFDSGKNKYCIRTTKKISERFKFNKTYTAFMDHKIPFINIKELREKHKEDSYSKALKEIPEIVTATRYIHSIREGDKNFIYQKN